MKKIIALDIDDTLNDYTKTFKTAEFKYHDKEFYDKHIDSIRTGTWDQKNDKLYELYDSLDFQCWVQAKPVEGAAEFSQWLQSKGYKVVILTFRDIRQTSATTNWLVKNGIVYDDLFSTDNKGLFCGLWKIPLLVDDAAVNILNAHKYNTKIFYPTLPHIEERLKDYEIPATAQKYSSILEVKQWL